MLAYLLSLTRPRIVLWCYLIWWLGVAIPYFDRTPSLWLNSFGIAAIIGTGLYLSTAHAGAVRVALPTVAVVRLYLMPFFVSSFAALIKGRGFWLVFHPTWRGNLWPTSVCVLFVGAVYLLKMAHAARPNSRSAKPAG